MYAFHVTERATHKTLNCWVQVNRKDNDRIIKTPHDFFQRTADALNALAKRFSAMARDEDHALSS
jgi:hypothetical protein